MVRANILVSMAASGFLQNLIDWLEVGLDEKRTSNWRWILEGVRNLQAH